MNSDAAPAPRRLTDKVYSPRMNQYGDQTAEQKVPDKRYENAHLVSSFLIRDITVNHPLENQLAGAFFRLSSNIGKRRPCSSWLIPSRPVAWIFAALLSN